MTIPTTFVRRATAVFAGAILLCTAACGGGGGGSQSLPPASGGAPTTSPAGTGQAMLSITVRPPGTGASSKHRHANFVAPTTASVTYQAANATTTSALVTQNIGSGVPGCSTSGSAVTCSTTVSAPVGSDTITVKTYDAANAGGTLLGTAVAPETIVLNQTNAVTLAVGGVIANIQLYLATPSVATASAGQSLLIVVPLDANGNQIVNPGNYDVPIALSTSGGGGHVTFAENGDAPSATASVASPNDQVYVKYDGLGTAGAVNILASAAEAMTVTASTLFQIGSGALTGALGSAGFIFTAVGQTGSIAFSGGSGGALSVSSLNGSVASASVSGSNVTVTANGYGATTITVTQGSTHITYPVSVNAPAITATCTGAASCTAGYVFANGSTSTGTIAVGGGTGTFTGAMVSGTNAVAAIAQTNATTFTITPSGSGTDAVVITSGNQSLYVPVTVGSAAAASQIIPTAYAYYDGTTLEMVQNIGSAVIAVQNAGSLTTSGCTSNVAVSANASGLEVTAGAGLGSCTLTISSGGSTLATLPMTTVMPIHTSQAQTFDAPGETAYLTVSGGTGSFTASSSSTAYATVPGGTLSTGANTLTITGPATTAVPAVNPAGSATITLTDAHLGDTATIAVTDSNAYASNFTPYAFASGLSSYDTQDTSINTDSRSISDLGTVRGRLGYLVTPPLLFYATGGLAYGRVGASSSISQTFVPMFGAAGSLASYGGSVDTRVGWTIGAGAEWMFAPNWSVKVEYAYYDLGSLRYSISPLVNQAAGVVNFSSVASSSVRFNGSIVRAGLNYHFNFDGPDPVVARY